jgi:acyl-coenzyme A thioesterase PaaI-like protein
VSSRELTGELSLQERYGPESVCYGCGPANPKGFHIRSFPDAESTDVVCKWQPQPHHHAFENVLNGGVIGTLLDCHCNWTAAYHLMGVRGADAPPTTVTADYSIKLLKPTPTDRPVRLRARVVDSTADRATVEGTLESDGVVTATCRATFVAVKPGHPAYGRW